jgi:hypothetical protein
MKAQKARDTDASAVQDLWPDPSVATIKARMPNSDVSDVDSWFKAPGA